MTYWERLGIVPTTDKKAIRKAYAAKAKECHQEDEPEQWVRLHDAYKTALKYAEAASGQGQKVYYHSPWEQPQPESTKTEPEPKLELSKEELQQQGNDREMEQLFKYLSENARESEQKLMAELRVQLWQLSQAASEEEAGKWRAFLESWTSQKLYLSEAYWNEIFAALKNKKLQKNTYSVIYEELRYLSVSLSMQFTAEQKECMENCMKICERHMQIGKWKEIEKEQRRYTKRQEKIGRRIGIFFTVLMLMSACYGFYLDFSGSNLRHTSKSEVKNQLAAYLNEKYETTIYQPEMFETEALEKTCIEDGRTREVEAGYRITIAEQPEFTAYVLFQYDNKRKVVGTICFDNLQRTEIEETFTAELLERLELSRAEGYLSAGDAGFAAGLMSEEDTVYNTLFAGDLSQFAEAEKNIRGQIANRYVFIVDRYALGNETNGSFLLYYADEKTPDLRARLGAENAADAELETDDKNNRIAAELEAFQDEYHIQMTAVGLPESYYQALFESGEEKTDGDILREVSATKFENIPLNPAVVSTWFTAPEEELVTTYPQELFGEQEASWIHEPEVTELAEGIYALPRRDTENVQGNAKDVPEVKMNEADGEIQIFVNEDLQTQYVIVLDKERLGIGKEYQIELLNEAGERELTYAQEPYTNLDYVAMSYTALEGEELLLVDCYSQSGNIIDIRWQP